MDFAKSGADALTKSDGLTAASAYTRALIEHPASPDYFCQRSIAFTRMKPPRYDLALKDAEIAVLLGQKREKREKIQAAQQRRVVALFGLQRYYDAQFILQTMEKWRPKQATPGTLQKDRQEGDMWNARVAQKVKRLSAAGQENKQTVQAQEYPEGPVLDEKAMKAWLRGQLKADGTYRFEGEADTLPGVEPGPSTNGSNAKRKVESSESTAITSNTAKTSVSPTAAPILSKIRHEWYQNAQSVIVTLYARSVPRDKAQIEIEEDSVFVSFPHPLNPSSTFTFSLDPLFALVDAHASSSVVMLNKVEFTLQKQVPGQKWPSLEGTAPLKNREDGTNSAQKTADITDLPTSVTKIPDVAPSYPTSSKSGPKNWDKLAEDLTMKPKKKHKKDDKENGQSGSGEEDDGYDSEFEGGDAVDGFFKKLYAGADPETRRAMQKSYIESNGTALSTNWSEVGKGKVEEVKSKDDD